jgi:hypothetical protein
MNDGIRSLPPLSWERGQRHPQTIKDSHVLQSTQHHDAELLKIAKQRREPARIQPKTSLGAAANNRRHYTLFLGHELKTDPNIRADCPGRM